ncbi:MAG: RNA polymerase sigma factor [Candidatus Peregrinibacteria bacterium]
MIPESLNDSADLEAAFLAWNEQFFRYVFARTRQQAISEDIVQDVFTKAWEKRHTFCPQQASLRTWLFTIMVNTMRDHFRRQKRRGTDPLDDDIADDIDIVHDADTAVMSEFVLVRLRMLSEREQELLTLRYINALSIQEVCGITGMKESAVKVAIHRAIAKLRDMCNADL